MTGGSTLLPQKERSKEQLRTGLLLKEILTTTLSRQTDVNCLVLMMHILNNK